MCPARHQEVTVHNPRTANTLRVRDRTDSNWDQIYSGTQFGSWLDHPGPEFEDAVDPFLSTLKTWVKTFNLRAQWMVDAGIRTVRAWESDLNWEGLPPWVIRSAEIYGGLS